MVRRRLTNQFTPWTRLEELRLDAGMPYPADLAEKVPCSPSYLYQLEQGSRRPSGDMLIKLARVFGMRPSDLGKTIPTVPPRGSVARRTETTAAVAS